MDKIYCQLDVLGFFIGLTANNFNGALDIEVPTFNKETEKAKLVDGAWVIKSIIEWELKEGEKLVNNEIETTEKPSELHSWNFETKAWYLDEEKVKISKLPTSEDIEKSKIENILINLLTEGGMI